MEINVVGLGYIGLPTALMLAAHGNKVIGTDYNKELVDRLKHGEISFEEKGLPELYEEAVHNQIVFSTEYKTAGVYIIAVPTPYIKKDRKIDAAYIRKAVESVLDVCPQGGIIVLESTVSPGTIDKYVRDLVKERKKVCGKDVHLVHAPERIIPGRMVHELENNNRTIGADAPEIGNKIRQIYKSFCKGEIEITDIRTAEMTKVVENTYRDINIAFANELAKICRSDNMDVYEIIKIANMHPRVNILSPGPGVGGHCISVDPWFLVGDYPGLANLILAARKINDSMPEFVLGRVSDIMAENGIGDVGRVGFYGLTYKEDVDDVRESPTLQLLDCMKRHLAGGVKVYDPYVKEDIVPGQYHNLEEFLEGIDIVVIMVGHNEIIEKQELLSRKLVVDTRNVLHKINRYSL